MWLFVNSNTYRWHDRPGVERGQTNGQDDRMRIFVRPFHVGVG